MKNHIKNYIKIMGLAAVPFGTAQAEVITIRVVKEETTEEKGARFIISKENEKGECLESVSILWRDKDDYPAPILQPKGWLRVTGAPCGDVFGYREALGCVFRNMRSWMDYYGRNKFSNGFLSKVVLQFASSDLVPRGNGKVSEFISYDHICSFFRSGPITRKVIYDWYTDWSLVMDRYHSRKVKWKESYYDIAVQLNKLMHRLPGCMCALYGTYGGFYFFLIRDNKAHRFNGSKYALVICSPVEGLCVFSDIPVMSRGSFAVYSDNESNIDIEFVDSDFSGRPYRGHYARLPLRVSAHMSANHVPAYEDILVTKIYSGVKKIDANGNTYVEYKKGDPVFLKVSTSDENWKFLTKRNFKTPQELIDIIAETCKVREQRKKNKAEMYECDLFRGRKSSELREEKVEDQNTVPAKHEIKIAECETIEEMRQDLLKIKIRKKPRKMRKRGKILKKEEKEKEKIEEKKGCERDKRRKITTSNI